MGFLYFTIVQSQYFFINGINLFNTQTLLDPTSKDARQSAWKDFDPSAKWSATNKAWRIDIGGFKTDPHRTIVGRGLQFLSRWTWELPQTVLGKTISHVRNMTGNVDDVSYYGGAT